MLMITDTCLTPRAQTPELSQVSQRLVFSVLTSDQSIQLLCGDVRCMLRFTDI